MSLKAREIIAAKTARRKAETDIRQASAVRKLGEGGEWKFDADNEKVVVITELSEADAKEFAAALVDFFS